MKIGIFCSANNDIDPDYFAMTMDLGAWIAKNGHSIVYGGCNMGLMECIAKTVHDAGGRTIGVIPTKVEERGRVSKYVDTEFRCADLNDRKAILTDQSDVLVALPGGIGTLDELFTVAAAATIGYHSKRVILYNMKGFWNPLISLLDSLQQQGLTRMHYSKQIQTANNLEELIQLIDAE